VSGSSVAAGGTCTVVVSYNPGGVTTTATAYVTVTGGPVTVNSPSFNGT
jgi:hypothetical protein